MICNANIDFMFTFKVIVILLLLTFIFFSNINAENDKRGIIIPLGPSRIHFSGAWATFKMVHDFYKCQLPVQFWSYFNESLLLPPSVLNILNSTEGVSYHVIPNSVELNNERVINKVPQWDIEGDWYLDYIRFSSMPLALIYTNFEEVMALDADDIISNPDDIFQTEQYIETNILFMG